MIVCQLFLDPEDEKYMAKSRYKRYSSELNHLLAPLQEGLLEAYEVSNLVNSPKNNSPQLIERIS